MDAKSFNIKFFKRLRLQGVIGRSKSHLHYTCDVLTDLNVPILHIIDCNTQGFVEKYMYGLAHFSNVSIVDNNLSSLTIHHNCGP